MLSWTSPHPTFQHSHGENLPHLSGLPGTADRATRLGEVPHLPCESSQEKKRDCMERLVTPPRRGTSPTWGPPPPCEQALTAITILLSMATHSFPVFFNPIFNIAVIISSKTGAHHLANLYILKTWISLERKKIVKSVFLLTQTTCLYFKMA